MSLRAFGITGSFLVLLLLLLPTPGASLPSPFTSLDPPPDTTKPLRPLMVGLAQDMDRIATGLWHEDYDLIEQGARNIA
ncbi:MAG: hypothetical protein ABEL04_10290 [Salinibacter sp.]|uniref:hypothetical protein n=1 Tax=Salinibacter sp. TaxID=2065818 RepID=UPI0035D52BA3